MPWLGIETAQSMRTPIPAAVRSVGAAPQAVAAGSSTKCGARLSARRFSERMAELAMEHQLLAAEHEQLEGHFRLYSSIPVVPCSPSPKAAKAAPTFFPDKFQVKENGLEASIDVSDISLEDVDDGERSPRHVLGRAHESMVSAHTLFPRISTETLLRPSALSAVGPLEDRMSRPGGHCEIQWDPKWDASVEDRYQESFGALDSNNSTPISPGFSPTRLALSSSPTRLDCLPARSAKSLNRPSHAKVKTCGSYCGFQACGERESAFGGYCCRRCFNHPGQHGPLCGRLPFIEPEEGMSVVATGTRKVSIQSARPSVGPPHAEFGLKRSFTNESTSAKSLSQQNADVSASAKSRKSLLFPAWFDPGREEPVAFKLSMNKQGSVETQIAEAREKEADGPPDLCVFDPVSRLRLLWDMIAFLLLIWEMWVTPFELIFMSDVGVPFLFEILSHFITAFFASDIILNFSTGYIEGNKTIMKRSLIVRTYMRSWFWVDLIATLPFHMLLTSADEEGGEMSEGLAIVRAGKATKALKTLRYLKYLKVIRAVRLFSSVRKASMWQRHFTNLGAMTVVVLRTSQVLAMLLLVAHVNGCLYASVQEQWAYATDVGEALGKYFQCLWWAYTTMGDGSTHLQSYQSHWVRVIEMLVTSQRLLLIAALSTQAAYFVQRQMMESASDSLIKDRALQYLRRHKVSFRTQLEVVYSLHETGKANRMQRHFNELMANDLPVQLRRTICEELWATRLMSLGLLMHMAHWNDDFIAELSLLVLEEVFPSRANMFREGDAAIAAYNIIQGSLGLTSSFSVTPIADLTAGMWLGEKALINPALRRGATAITLEVTTTMCVPAESFQKMLKRLNLLLRFQSFCSDRLWQGLCGRCGVLGDHFDDLCPTLQGQAGPVDSFDGFGRKSVTGSDSAMHIASVSDHSRTPTWVHRNISKMLNIKRARLQMYQLDATNFSAANNLDKYLSHHHLEKILPHLEQLKVESLDDLEEELEQVRACLREACENGTLVLSDRSDTMWRALTKDAITKFRDQKSKATQQVLFSSVTRSQHLIFLSHHKLEAGTEAALMRTELLNSMKEDPAKPGNSMDAPVFLDSEDLTSLADVQQRVRMSHNLVLLLTCKTLTRPWILVEIVTAVNEGLRVLPVLVAKVGGHEFQIPDEPFYSQLRDGTALDVTGQQVISDAGYEMDDIIDALRMVFQRIIVPYSPHRSETIRQAEIASVLRQCVLKRRANFGEECPMPSDVERGYEGTMSTGGLHRFETG